MDFVQVELSLGRNRSHREQAREILARGKLFRAGHILRVRGRDAALARERRAVSRCQTQTSGIAPGELW